MNFNQVRGKGQGQSDHKMVHDTPLSKDASTHLSWGSYLNQNWRYTLDMIILEMRSCLGHSDLNMELNLRDPEMHSHTKFGIPTSNNAVDMLQSQLFKKRGQGHNNPKRYPTLCHPKVQGKFGIPTSNNVGDMLWTQLDTL